MQLVETKQFDPEVFRRVWTVMHDERTALAGIFQVVVDGTFTVCYTRAGHADPVVRRGLCDLAGAVGYFEQVRRTEVIVPRPILHMNILENVRPQTLTNLLRRA